MIGEPSLPISERLQPVDFKEFIVKLFLGISTEVTEKYKKGWSLRDIAKDLGVSKNGVRSILLRGRVTLRENITQATNKRKLNSGKNSARPYFGFCYFEGQIIKDPREFPTLKLIYCRFEQDRTIHEITMELNKVSIPSRSGKKWSWAAVQNIVQRFKDKKIILLKGGKYEFR